MAIDYTLRRIAAKCTNNFALAILGNKLFPEQLGLDCTRDCEAAVHATRRFMSIVPADFVIAKLDFSNAFNNLCTGVMLSAVAENTPDIYRFCHIAYDKPTHFIFSFTRFYRKKMLNKVTLWFRYFSACRFILCRCRVKVT